MKKVKVLAMVMMLTFAAMGAAYALWFDTLKIEETVTTGTVDVVWENVVSSDCGCNYEAHDNNVYAGSLDSMDVGNPNDSKNIGCKQGVIGTIAGDNTGNNDGGRSDLLTLTLTNGYPGYQEYVKADIKNTGTVPVKFMLSITADEQNVVYDADTNPTGWLIVEPTLANGEEGETIEGYQLDPGKTVSVKINQRVRQVAPQDANADFAYTIQAVQWNEYDFYPLPDEITEPRITGPDANPTINPIPWDDNGFGPNAGTTTP